MRSEFGLFIEKLRGDLDLTLREAAERSGLSHAYIRDLELGKNRKTKAPISPTAETIRRLANAYDYDYNNLLRKAGILEKEHEDNTDELDNLISKKTSKLSEEKKRHLLKYIEFIQNDSN